jgi:hypothetical protein
MRGELPTPHDLSGRFVRVCPAHRRILDELECPAGHHVDTWATLDRHTNQIKAEGIDADHGELLAHEAPRTAPRLLSLGGTKQEKGSEMKATAGEAKVRVILSQRLEDSAKTLLFVQLVAVAVSKGNLDPFRLKWRRKLPDGKVNTGIEATAELEKVGRDLWKAAVARALAAGWIQSAHSWTGGRRLSFRPIPAPAGAAGRPLDRGRRSSKK